MVTLDTDRNQKRKQKVKTGLAELGPFLTEVPDMAKTSALVQVCSLNIGHLG